MSGAPNEIAYPGILSPVSARVSIGLGVFPGVAVIEMNPQEEVPARLGALTLRGGGGTVTLPGMTLDRAEVSMDARGWINRIVLRDTRWRWRYGTFSLVANRKLPNGFLDPWSLASLQEIAQAAAVSLEISLDVSALPNERPTVFWPVKKCVAALDWICKVYGFELAWDWAGNRYKFVQLGKGTRPDVPDDLTFGSLVLDPAEAPTRVRVIGGADTFQTKLEMEPVAMDVDGQIKPLADLSYRPDRGWTTSRDPFSFADVPGQAQRELARQYAFRAYRVVGQTTGGLGLPFSHLDRPTPLTRDAILPLLPTLAEPQTDSTGQLHRVPFAEGRFIPPNRLPDIVEADEGSRTPDFRMSSREGLIYFAAPMVRFEGAGFRAADVHLTAAYRVAEGFLPYSPFRFLATGLATAGPTPDEVEHHPEVERAFIGRYGSGPAYRNYTGQIDNYAQTDAAMQLFLQAMKSKWENVQGESLHFRGIHDIRLDGLVRQVRWTIDTQQGSDTVAFCNTEGAAGLMAGRARRMAAQLAEDAGRTIERLNQLSLTGW